MIKTISANGTTSLGDSGGSSSATKVIQLTGTGWTGNIQVVKRLAGSSDAWVACPYVAEYLNGAVSDRLFRATAISGDSFVLVDAAGAEIALIVTGFAAGSMAVDYTDRSGTPATSGSSSGGALTDAQLRASPVPVTVPVGQALAVASTPVVLTAVQIAAITPTKGAGAVDASTTRTTLASDDPAVTVLGSKTDAAWDGAAASASLVAIAKKQYAASVDPAAVTAISATALPLPTGAALDATLTNNLGSLTETAPASDTASSGLNGRLQRLAQRLTSLLTVFPTTLSLNAGAAGASTLRVALDTGITSAKGTQAASAVGTQDLKDAGRSDISLIVDRFQASASAETIINSMSSGVSYAARTGSLSSYSVTGGKTFRLQALYAILSVVNGNTTAVGAILRMRVNTGGAATVSSPIAGEWIIASAVANPSGSIFLTGAFALTVLFPDGREIPAGAGIAFTLEVPGEAATTANPAVTVLADGYEY